MLDIVPGDCAKEDWVALAGILADMRRLTLRETITVRLLDEAGGKPAATWQAAGAPSLGASPAEQGGTTLLFATRDTASRRAPLLLYRDSSSGSLVLRDPLSRPPPPRPGHASAGQ